MGDEMIKVLFVIPNLGHGGAEKVLVNLLKHIDRKKFSASIFCIYDEGVNKTELPNDISYSSFFKRSFKGSGYLLKLFSPEFLYRHMIKQQYDMVVSYLEGQTARIVSGCKDSNCKLVSWIHVEQHSAKNAARMFRSVNEMHKCYSSFDHIACVSKFVKHDFMTICPEIDKSKIDVLYNTVESDIILDLSKKKMDIRFDKSKINLCGIGTLKKSKGFDRLIRIHKRLKDDGYPIHTYLLGEGPEEKTIRKMIDEYRLNDSITLLGYQINPYKYIKNSDIFVCCSYAEGFSTAATEALIVGTAVCTVDVSGMKEMLGENNEYGIVTDNDDEQLYIGLKNLIDDPKLLQHYKLKALERARIFETKNTVFSVEDKLTEVVRRS